MAVWHFLNWTPLDQLMRVTLAYAGSAYTQGVRRTPVSHTQHDNHAEEELLFQGPTLKYYCTHSCHLFCCAKNVSGSFWFKNNSFLYY